MLIIVKFELNPGCYQEVDWSNLPKGTNISRLASEWAIDLHAIDYKIERTNN